MYKQDFYEDRRGIQFGYEFDNEAISLQSHYQDPNYYTRGYRSAPYPTRSLTPQDSNPDCNQVQRKRIAVACSRCRKRKIKCSGESVNGMGCSNCQNAGATNCNFVRVGARDLGEIVSSQSNGWHAMVSPAMPLVPFASPPKMHGISFGNHNDDVDKDISPTIASVHETDYYYRPSTYALQLENRGPLAPQPSGTQEFNQYAIADRTRRQVVHIEEQSPTIHPVYAQTDANNGQFIANDKSLSRNSLLATTSAPSINVEEHYTGTPQYLSERQLPPLPPWPTMTSAPNPYDITQRSSSFYFPGHAQWSTPYSCIRTPVPHDIERNSVSSYRSGSFTDSNGYSMPNTSQSSFTAETEYVGDHRNGTIAAQNVPYTTADSTSCSQHIPYNMRRSGDDMQQGIMVSNHNKSEEGMRDGTFNVKEVSNYTWSPHQKRQSYVSGEDNTTQSDIDNMQPLSDNAAAQTLSALRIGCDTNSNVTGKSSKGNP